MVNSDEGSVSFSDVLHPDGERGFVAPRTSTLLHAWPRCSPGNLPALPQGVAEK